MPLKTIYRFRRSKEWEFHAGDIELCELEANQYKVKFFNNATIYWYRKENIQLFNYAITYSAPFVCAQFNNDKRIIDNARKIDEYHYRIGNQVVLKCWRINDGTIYSSEKIIVTSCNVDKTEDILKYLNAIAEYGELRTEDGNPLLPIQYRKIKSIASNSPFSIYLGDGKNQEHPIENLMIFPFGCNKCQYQAVKNALTNTISIIQGPPGTGKTQTILNIIANLLLQGKNIQVVSNNNAAVENIYEKLASEAYQLGFLVAQMGSIERQNLFFDSLQSEYYPDLSSWRITQRGQVSHIDRLIREKTEQSLSLFEKQERIAKFKEELQQLTIEQCHYEQYLSTSHLNLQSSHISGDMSSKMILRKIQGIERRIRFRERWWMIDEIYSFVLRLLGHEERDNERLHSLKKLFYIRRKEELENEIKHLSYLVDKNAPVLKELEDLSLRRLRGVLYNKYGKMRQRVVYTREDALQNHPQQFLQDYPVVLSTTFSALNNIPTSYRYDYVIMDEASQVDIATGALALYSADNAVIVGDDKQLHNVVNPIYGDITDSIYQQFNIPKCYKYHLNYIGNSILQSILSMSANIPNVLLREHYRCHPLIIGFCNKRFYDNQLLIMSDYQSNENALNIIRTTAGNHARGHVNQRQIESIMTEILPNLPFNSNEVGIISPYNAQVSAINQVLHENGKDNISVATVHKFQGREKDAIILSTVDNEPNDFVDDPNLLNVAISRAKKRLYVILPYELSNGILNDLVSYVEYSNGKIVSSKIYSVFDLLYTAYTKERLQLLQPYSKVSDYDSERAFYKLLSDMLVKYNLNTLKIYNNYPLRNIIKQTEILTDEERRYLFRSGTHVDFLLSDVVTNQPILAMEVDGSTYHSRGSKQHERDMIKNSIFSKFPEISFQRFSTKGSSEEEIILSILRQRGYIQITARA